MFTRYTRIRARWNPLSLLLLIGSSALALQVGHFIGSGNLAQLHFVLIALALAVISLFLLSKWQVGVYFFLIWLTFEDLIRKYMGNNMIIFLAKDALVAVAYLAFFMQWQQRRVAFFRSPFFFPLLIFFWLGVAQALNPLSPSIFYGLFGLKLYFYYVPLMFLGYALINSETDLQRFLIFNMILASIVSLLGIIQSIIGPEFLNPPTLAPELERLNMLFRQSPEGGEAFHRPTGVFISDGRFAWYLLLMFYLAIGTVAYFLLLDRVTTGTAVVLISPGFILTAIVMSGSRGTFGMTLISLVVLGPTILWQIPKRRTELMRFARGMLLASGILGAGIVVMIVLFPKDISARWDFYYQTMAPWSSHNEAGYRSSGFPLEQFLYAASAPYASTGYGIGTASQAVPYVMSLLGAPRPPTRFVESGFGTLVVELGYLGLMLWLIWTLGLMRSIWHVFHALQTTRIFPVFFSVFWFIFVLLFWNIYGGIMTYQNFVYNAYLWLLIGILFRLPGLLPENQPVVPQSYIQTTLSLPREHRVKAARSTHP